MAIPSRQIGWGTESNLLWQILKQLNKLTSVLFGLKEAATPNYKVFTALLSQSGATDELILSSGAVTKGVTYRIDAANDGDFSNVGATTNEGGTYFIAINNEVPNSYGSAALLYDPGAPVATVLENTIGNIWFTYDGVGSYGIDSNSLFTANKTASFISGLEGQVGAGGGSPLGGGTSIVIIDTSNLYFSVIDTNGNSTDNSLNGYPIEIRVYN